MVNRLLATGVTLFLAGYPMLACSPSSLEESTLPEVDAAVEPGIDAIVETAMQTEDFVDSYALINKAYELVGFEDFLKWGDDPKDADYTFSQGDNLYRISTYSHINFIGAPPYIPETRHESILIYEVFPKTRDILIGMNFDGDISVIRSNYPSNMDIEDLDELAYWAIDHGVHEFPSSGFGSMKVQNPDVMNTYQRLAGIVMAYEPLDDSER